MSEKKCILCGAEIVEGLCPNLSQHIRPMCLNCAHMRCLEENDFCHNEENKSEAAEKLKSSLPAGYELAIFELKPLPLKDSTKRCKRWAPNLVAITDALEKMLTE